MKVLFVCLGNICRSPAAEAVMQKMINDQSLDIQVDSAGTSGYHVGEKADSRMREQAIKRGIEVTSIARQFVARDFIKFDYILVMDDSNYHDVLLLDPKGEYLHKISKITDYCSERFKDIDHVLDLLQDSCFNFLNHLPKSK